VANFKTHLSAGYAANIAAVTGLWLTGMADIPESLLYVVAGTVGSILPDIDANKSLPLKLMFNIAALIIAFFALLGQKSDTPPLFLFLLWSAVFLSVRYGGLFIFSRLTVHRGLIHSVPAGVLCCFLTTVLLYRIFHASNFTAWMTGIFVFFGFLIHLILDEFSSIRMSEKRIKKSFGTALKAGSFKYLKKTLMLYITIIALFCLTPAPGSFVHAVLKKSPWLAP
jgi:uncharacterized membrane protein